MKYIITWAIIQMTAGSCPDTQKENKFGITPNVYMSCAVLHLEERKTHAQKEFSSKKEAILFLEDIRKYSTENQGIGSFGQDKIIDIKIDSLNIK